MNQFQRSLTILVCLTGILPTLIKPADTALEQQALGNITSLISQQSTNLAAPLANLQTTFNAIAQNLANISSSSTSNYNAATTAINNFINALFTQATITLVAQKNQGQITGNGATQLAPLLNALKTAFASHSSIQSALAAASTSAQTTIAAATGPGGSATTAPTNTPAASASEQQALTTILNLIPQVNLADSLANLTPPLGTLAQNLSRIATTSGRYTIAVAAINAFLDALVWQGVSAISSQKSQETNPANIVPLLDPLFNLLKSSFSAHAAVLAEINRIYPSAQESLTWLCQANAAAINAQQAITLNTSNTELLASTNTAYQNVGQVLPDYYLQTLGSLIAAKSRNTGYNSLLAIYTDLQKKATP